MACSSCLLTMGFTPNCATKVPGGNNLKFYLIPKCNVVSFDDTYSNGIIDDITLEAGAYFYEVRANKDSVTTTEDVTLPNKFITQTLVFTITNIGDDLDKEVGAQLASDFAADILNSDEGIMVIVEDRAGIRKIYGYQNGLEISAGQKVSGAAIADVAGNTITLVGGEPTYAPVLTSDYAIPTS